MKTLDVDSMATVQSRLCVLFLDRTSLSGVLSVKSLGFSGQRQMGRLHVRDYVTFPG